MLNFEDEMKKTVELLQIPKQLVLVDPQLFNKRRTDFKDEMRFVSAAICVAQEFSRVEYSFKAERMRILRAIEEHLQDLAKTLTDDMARFVFIEVMFMNHRNESNPFGDYGQIIARVVS